MVGYASYGISAIDRLLGGGMIPGSSYLLEIEPGTEETTFIAAFLNEGLRQGNICGVISFDMSHEELIDILVERGVDVNSALRLGSMVIADMWSEGKYDSERKGPILMTDHVNDANSAVRLYYDLAQMNQMKLKTGRYTGTRIAICSLSSEIMNYKFEPTYKLSKMGLDFIRRGGAVSLTVVNPKMLDDTVFSAFEHLNEGILVLSMKESKGRFQRFFRVKRSPLPGYYTTEVPYDIVGNEPRLATPFAAPFSMFRDLMKYSADGSIDMLGLRLTMSEATYIPALMEHFVAAFGYERVSEEVYKFFKSYGQTLLKKLLSSMKVEMASSDPKTLVESFNGFVSSFGMGMVKLLSFSCDSASFRVTNSLCTNSAQTGRPMNPYLAGIFAGIVESVLSKPIKCAELKCVAKGDDCCEFYCGVDTVKTDEREPVS